MKKGLLNTLMFVFIGSAFVLAGFLYLRDKDVTFNEGDASVGDEVQGSIEELTKLTELGKWIDAREQGSYYSSHGSIIRDDNGGMHVYYCSSGEDYKEGIAPDWRDTAKRSSDYVRHQFSTDDGKTWSDADVIIKAHRKGTQDDLFQGACTNSIVYLDGYYYIYFESYTPPTKMISIHVARSKNPDGPYEAWTNDGWKSIPTSSTWKPVLKPKLLEIPGGEKHALNYIDAQGNKYWGAGIPRATKKDGKIYLYYVDTSYFVLWDNGSQNGDITPDNQIPYQFVSVSNDPVKFTNHIDNKLKDSSGNEVWGGFQVKYYPDQNSLVGIYASKQSGEDKIVFRESTDGKIWSEEKDIADLPDGFDVADKQPEPGNSEVSIYTTIGILSDKHGTIDISDLYLALWKKWIGDDTPWGWADSPSNWGWYYGGIDTYGFKLGYEDEWDCNNDEKIDCWDTNGDRKVDAYDTNGPDGTPDGNANMWDKDFDGAIDCFDTSFDGECNMGKTSGSEKINWWKYGENGICYDTNGNDKCDNFDLDGDENDPHLIDAWNSDVNTDNWGLPNMWDNDNDGEADAFDTTGDGVANWFK